VVVPVSDPLCDDSFSESISLLRGSPKG